MGFWILLVLVVVSSHLTGLTSLANQDQDDGMGNEMKGDMMRVCGGVNFDGSLIIILFSHLSLV